MVGDVAYLTIPLYIGGVIGDGLCDTKVDELQAALDKDEIGRFEIRVNDSLFMNHADRLQHLV